MAFEKFEGGGRGRPRGVTDAKISLRKSGSIGINAKALEEYFDGAGAVVCYYDDDENRVALRPVDSKDADDAAYTLSANESGATVTPGAFLKEYDLIPDITTHYTPEEGSIGGEDAVIFDLDDPIGTYGSEGKD